MFFLVCIPKKAGKVKQNKVAPAELKPTKEAPRLSTVEDLLESSPYSGPNIANWANKLDSVSNGQQSPNNATGVQDAQLDKLGKRIRERSATACSASVKLYFVSILAENVVFMG